MALWFVFALMTAAAIFAVLWALSRNPAARSGSDLAVYRDQLDEIGRDRDAGRIGDAEAEAARVEVSRRLLAAAEAAEKASGQDSTGASWRRRAAALIALLVLPVGAAALYLQVGSPSLPDQPLAQRRNTPPQERSIESMVAQIEAHLEKNPTDGRGWEVVAPVYMRVGRFADAVKARQNALRYSGATADREAFVGEAMVAAANGMVTADAKAAFERAVQLDAKNVTARFFLGLSAQQDGRREEAATIWNAMIKDAPADAPWVGFVREALARLQSPAAETPGPSADDVAAAEKLTPDQRTAMITGMVERLADKLKQDGSDVEGWIRLLRAYKVLGDTERARAALADARRALKDVPDKTKLLDAAAKELGLEG